MTTTFQVHGGVRVIGGTKVLVESERARVLLDIGLDLPEGPDLFRGPVPAREGGALADRIRVGAAPRIPGLFAPEHLTAVGPGADELAALAAADPRPTAIVLSHAHIDHDGLLPYVRADVPVLCHPDTLALHRALEAAGLTPPGTAARLTPLDVDEPRALEDLEVTIHRVDHDIRGAVGTVVRTPSGTLAYTGDLNLHRDGGEHTRRFMERVRGAEVLVAETTMLSFDPLPEEPRSEQEVARVVRDALEAPALMLLSAYERDVDRARLLIETARDAGRTLVWPGRHAAVLTAMGIDGVTTWDASRPQTLGQERAGRLALSQGAAAVSLDAVRAAPAAHLVQIDAQDFPSLLDLPLGPGSAWIHSQGEPLGPFMPDWEGWQDWLAHLGLGTVPAGSSGHAGPHGLAEIVQGIDPSTLVALHGMHPERLPTAGAELVLPEIGQTYRLRG